MTLGELARSIAERLTGSGISEPEARLDAELLLRSTLRWSRARWIQESRAPVTQALADAVEPLVARRQRREPMAYVLGHCEFWGLDFEVSPAVLIPRPESEIIVEEALARLPAERPVRVVDVGTGSGCLAVSLAVERPRLELRATDISEAALALARKNAVRHEVADRLVFQHASLCGPMDTAPAHLIVSNPPYVATGDRATLPPEVGRFEPATALFAGDDGLSIIRGLIADAPAHLDTGGWLIFEFGMGQEASVRDLLAPARWTAIEVKADLQGIARTAVARLR